MPRKNARPEARKKRAKLKVKMARKTTHRRGAMIAAPLSGASLALLAARLHAKERDEYIIGGPVHLAP